MLTSDRTDDLALNTTLKPGESLWVRDGYVVIGQQPPSWLPADPDLETS